MQRETRLRCGLHPYVRTIVASCIQRGVLARKLCPFAPRRIVTASWYMWLPGIAPTAHGYPFILKCGIPAPKVR